MNNKKHALTWCTDSVKSARVSPKVNDKFANWFEEKHGSDDLGHAKMTRGKHHDCLGMTSDFLRAKEC